MYGLYSSDLLFGKNPIHNMYTHYTERNTKIVLNILYPAFSNDKLDVETKRQKETEYNECGRNTAPVYNFKVTITELEI